MLIFIFLDQDVVLKVKLLGTENQLIGSNDGEMLSFLLTINKEDYVMNVTPYQAEKGTSINIKCNCSAKCILVEVKSVKMTKMTCKTVLSSFYNGSFLS